MKKLTISQVKALTILQHSSYENKYGCRYFADKMWGGIKFKTNMFTKHSNQGNGACVGKASWLCAGSYLAKLVKKKWLYVDYNPSLYWITNEGKQALKDHNEAYTLDHEKGNNKTGK